MEQCVRVLIADDQVYVRQGLQALLTVWPEIEVVGTGEYGIETVKLVEKCQPHVTLMDIPLRVSAVSVADRLGSLETIRLIKSRWPQIRIVMLMMYTALGAAALDAGADAFLLKGCPAEALRHAILKTV